MLEQENRKPENLRTIAARKMAALVIASVGQAATC